MSTTFKILRFDPLSKDAPHFQAYQHTPKPRDSMLDVLKDIRDHQDPALSFRYSCREAVCGSCAMTINGRFCLACRTQFEDLRTDPVLIEPLPNLEIQKDLVVDLRPFWEAYRFVQPYLQPEGEVPEKGYRIEEEKLKGVFQFITCIMCGCCYSACPVVSRDERYLGPGRPGQALPVRRGPPGQASVRRPGPGRFARGRLGMRHGLPLQRSLSQDGPAGGRDRRPEEKTRP